MWKLKMSRCERGRAVSSGGRAREKLEIRRCGLQSGLIAAKSGKARFAGVPSVQSVFHCNVERKLISAPVASFNLGEGRQGVKARPA
ncbi:hypothetical protein GOBAR_DD11508 [Gossypium barbadense]|nr:hypothetical protein GOBAR_DD11508 [Gossypium barbadense]